LVRCRGEILNSRYLIYGNVKRRRREQLRLHVRSFFVKLPNRFVGSKFLTHQFGEVDIRFGDVIELLQFPKVIVIYRENALESYVSLQIAQKNGIWYSESGVNRETIERERWRACLDVLDDDYPVHFVTFERMTSDPQATLAEVFEFLGLEPCHVHSGSVRQNPLALEEKISNYRELNITGERDHGAPELNVQALRREGVPAVVEK
jgi:hypothetical protein